MARSYLTAPGDDLVTDSGTVIWSLIRGEQLEFPVTLNFIEDVTAINPATQLPMYIFEAKLVEAQNVANQTTVPTSIMPVPAITDIVVRVPENRGTWESIQVYNKEDVVYYNSKHYKYLGGPPTTGEDPPNINPEWEETSLSIVYLQFPKTLGSNWTVQAGINYSVYGYFELRVTEAYDFLYPRTWKPVRGMVQMMYSPTFSLDD